MWIMTDAFWRDLATNIAQGAAATTFQMKKGVLGLIAAPFSPQPQLTLAEVVEATYSGYLRRDLDLLGVITGPFLSGDGTWYTDYGTQLWAPNDTVAVNTIYGQFILGHDSVTLCGSELFDAPIPLTGPFTSFMDDVRIGIPRLTQAGKSVVAP